MRIFLRLLLLLLASAGLLRPGEAQAQGNAFSCDGTFYQIRQVNGTSQIFRVDRSNSANYTTVALNVVNGSNDLGVLLNGLAYNSQDGYMYGLTTPGNSTTVPKGVVLYKIGQGGIVKIDSVRYGTATPKKALGIIVSSGTFDKTGHYYFTSQNTGTTDYNLYSLDLNSSTPQVATAVALSSNTTFYDLAYNPSDGLLYGANFSGSLYKINQVAAGSTAAGTVTAIATSSLSGTGNAVGSMFFDVAGNLFTYNNGSAANGNTAAIPANFSQVSTTTGAYTTISSINTASVSDGASCINPGTSIDVTKTATNVVTVSATQFDVTYDIRVRNTYTITDAYVQVSDLLMGNTTTTTNATFPTASSVSITKAPVVTNYSGAALVANSAYTGRSATPSGSSVSGAALLDGTQPLTAGQSALITYTVRVTYADANSVPTTARNNTAYATSSSAGPNPGYTLSSTDVLLSPNDLTASDASTNSASFPALRTTLTNGTPNATDTPSPTPVTFTPSINGTVFEDVNYGGGLGRSLGTSQGSGRSGARVELYTVNTTTGVATYSTTTTTAADGSYSFAGLTAGSSYQVRVVSSTVTSSRNTGSATGLVGVQTYRTSSTAAAGTVGDANRVGGEYPSRTEAANGAANSTITQLNAASTTTGVESLASVTLPSTSGPAIGVDFGYNFDTVVNTNDTGQGSLRQFITNANALDNTNLAQAAPSSGGTAPAAGVERSVFMITDGKAHNGLTAYDANTNPGLQSQLSSSGVAVITPATALPAIGGTYGTFTSLDGTTQTQNIGNTNNVTLGTGGTVGTGATALAQLNGPEVQLTGSTNVALGLDIATTGTNTLVRGLAIYGFGNTRDNDSAANIRSAANNVTITQNLLGTPATSFAQPNTPTNADNIRLTQGTAGIVVSNNLIGYSNSKGIAIDGVTADNNGVMGASITGNEVRGNGIAGGTYDGVDVQGSGNTISGNLLTGSAGQGLDSFRSAGSNTISGNTVTDNGRGTTNQAPVETPGVRIYGASNTVSQNVISDNYGAGILLEGATANGSIAATTTTVLSQNSIFNNGNVTSRNNTAATGEIGIDLEATGDTEATGTSPYVTANSTTTTGANGLQNYPILTSATVVGTNLVVQGYAKAGAAIELFVAQANPASVNATGTYFGQGKTYLATAKEGATTGVVDTDGTTGAYSGTSADGVNQGSDTNANKFSFAIPLSSLPAGALTNGTLAAGTLLTSTATLNGATSEFSGNLRSSQAPVPNDVTNVSVPDNTLTPVALNPNLSGTAYGTTTDITTNTANTIASYTVSLPSSGTLYYQGTALTAATTIPAANINQLTFKPVYGSTNTVTFTYTATDNYGAGVTSTTHKASDGTTPSGPATYTIPVGAAADVTTTLAGPATLNAGQPSGTFTAVFTNNGPQTANSVTQTVALPSGATLTTAQQTDLTNRYSGTSTSTSGGVTTITFPTASTLASGASNSFTLAFTAPTAATTAAVITSNVGTSAAPGQGANAAPDAASLTLTVNGVADVATTISSSAASVAAGGTVTLTAGFNNTLGNTAAAGVVGQVQLPTGLTGVTTSGGTYNATTGIITYTIGSLASGAAATALTITYTQPATGSVTAASSISTTTSEAGQVSNNTAAVTVAPTVTYDVATTISGPTSATVGSQVTYNVTTSNAGTGTNSNVVQTITLPSGATNAYATGGGVISTSGGVTTVTFPAIASLAAGQSVNNTVGFAAPSSSNNSFSTVANVTSTQDNGTTGNNTATATTTTTAAGTGSANLYTTIAASATNVAAGTAVTFTVNEGNNGPNAAANVVSTVLLPTGLPITGSRALLVNNAAPTSTSGTTATYAGGTTYNSATGLVTYAAIGTQNSASSITAYTLTFNAPASGVVTASASVSSSTPDVMMGNNVASTEVTVDPAATDLATTLTGPDQATAGQRVTYTATTLNNGPAAAAGIGQVVEIPAGLPITGTTAVYLNGAAPTSTSGTTATYSDGSTYNSSTGLVRFATLAAAQTTGGAVSNTVTYSVPANGNASTVQTARVSSTTNDANPANNVASVVTTIQPSADIQVTLTGPSTATPASATAGAPVTYGVTTTNNGPSVAGSVTTTVQLPTGLSGVVVTGYDGTVLTNSSTAGYNSSTGVVTFPAVTAQPSGAAYASSGAISFTTPPGANVLSPTATASLTATSANPATEPNLANNTATVVTTLSAPTTAQVDLSVTIARSTATAATVAAGSQVVFNVTTANASSSTASASSGAVTTVQLPAGLTSTGGTVTLTNSGTYDNATGLVTFTTTSALAAGSSLANTITISQAPGTASQLVAEATVRGNESDPTPANNTATTSVAITAVVDVATTIVGPSTSTLGGPVAYTVTTTNNGPSTATTVAQTVTLPAGIVSYSVNGGAAVQVNGGSASTSTTVVTLPVPATLAAGAANTVANTVAFNAPASASSFSYNVTSSVTAGNETGPTTNNTASAPTARYNQPPVATNVTNALQAPEGNSATASMLLSPLAATSASSAIKQFNLASIPPTSQGVLYYDNGGTATAITSSNYAALNLTPAQATTLRFLPASGYVGNASFTYTATDNASAVSNVATYLIPVGQDNSSTYTALAAKGGPNPYANGDILTYALDANGAQYTNGGTSAGTVYTTVGTLQSGAVNGLAGAALASTGPSGNTANTLPAGTALNTTTGQLYVTDRTLLPKTGATYTVNVVTTDVYGGVNTLTETFALGSYPLPVELTAFTAQAVQNRDALLSWTTASELNSDRFEVERSLDGLAFAKIGQVAAQGTKLTTTAYTFLDAGIGLKASGAVYYRLRQVDQDGTAAYSAIQAVRFAPATVVALSLYPNPAQAATSLELSQLPATGFYQVLVLDATGRQVLATTLAGGAARPLDVASLASGTYQVVVSGTQPNGSPLRQVLRLTKE